jgi:rhodanese-related sulfurtransferase
MSQLLDAIAGVPNADEPIPGLVTGGQPTAEHLAALKRAGAEVVVDLREAMEPQPFRVPDAVRALGLDYRAIPVGHGPLSDATFAALLAATRELAGRRRGFVYCGSGNRVGAGLLPYFLLDLKLPEEEAVTRALRVGLRSADLLQQALAFAERQQARPGNAATPE